MGVNFFCFLSSLASNISGSRQNIKNLVGNFLGKGLSCLHAKFKLSLASKLRQPFKWQMDGQTDFGLTSVIAPTLQ